MKRAVLLPRLILLHEPHVIERPLRIVQIAFDERFHQLLVVDAMISRSDGAVVIWLLVHA